MPSLPMTDENTPLREQVDRSGYAFNMGVAEVIRRSRDRQFWECTAVELPWSASLSKDGGFIDIAIMRDRAVGIIECKKVNNGDRLVFLTRHDQSESETRCRLDVYRKDKPQGGALPPQFETRFGTVECNMVSGSPESAYCVASKGPKSANLNLDDIASDLLASCEGLLGDWDLKLRDDPTVCIPIIVTNALLFTCAFDPAQMDLGSGDLPADAAFMSRPFVRFRKALRNGAGLTSLDVKDLDEVVGEGERTVFVVDSRQLVPFLAGLRSLMCTVDGGARQLVRG